MTLPIGHKLGPYEIVESIGAGGMGEVYRARDPRMGREVAIKISGEKFTERFDREVRAVASLNHVNICTLHDVGPNYLVMELVEGPTLAERIEQGAIPIEEALRIARQIGDALEAAHEKGIIHRDLKPGNVKLKDDGTVKVLDFGLAKVADAQSEGRVMDSPTLTVGATQAGVIVGTASYMSPEQARGRSVDKRADIWAFGVVLFEMLTGRRLFQGEDVSEILAAVIKEKPPLELVPERVRPLLQSCLERDPKRRLRDIGDAWRLLEDTPRARRAARKPWLGWTAAALFAIVAAVAVWAPWRTLPPTPEPMRLQIALPEKTTVGVFALSPDGHWLAFSGVGSDGLRRLWLRAMNSLEARPLRGTEGIGNPPPFWSPDSRFIAFDAGGKLKKIDISGGPPQTLCDLSNNAVGGSWSRAGVILFGTVGPIMQVSVTGGIATPITALDESRKENRHLFPVFLPDGRHFLYLRISSTVENNGIYIGSLDSTSAPGNSKPLLATAFGAAYVPPTDSSSGHLLFIRDQVLMQQPFDAQRLELTGEPVAVAEQVGSFINGGFFSASLSNVLVYRTGAAGNGLFGLLSWFDSDGKVLGPAWGEPGYLAAFALSPDGRHAAVSRLDLPSNNLDIWTIDFVRATSTRFTFGLGVSNNPVWSPDGSRIAFRSNRDGVYNLYQKLVSGEKDEEILLKNSENKMPTDWSHDGRLLLYVVLDPKRKNDLWVLPLEGDRKPVPLITTEFNESDARFSPDDHFIAYTSDDSSRAEVYIREFSGTSVGGKWQVSKSGGTNPRWRGDGKALFYSAPDGTVMEVDISTAPTFQAGAAKPAAKLPSGATPPIAAADGKRFLAAFPVAQDAQVPFTVILNWQAGLKN